MANQKYFMFITKTETDQIDRKENLEILCPNFVIMKNIISKKILK